MSHQRGWIGVDLDGTLAEYHGWEGAGVIGKPIPAMVDLVKGWLGNGEEVRIFTARVYPLGVYHVQQASKEYLSRLHDAQIARDAIHTWCREHLGQQLQVTCVKDYDMLVLYDDRAVQVVKNTGALVLGVTGPGKDS